MTDHLPGAGEMVYEARVLMANIRYQVFRPEVTTMGACPRCGESSRGAGLCADCLRDDLVRATGHWRAYRYVSACREQRAAELAILAAAGGGDERG